MTFSHFISSLFFHILYTVYMTLIRKILIFFKVFVFFIKSQIKLAANLGITKVTKS